MNKKLENSNIEHLILLDLENTIPSYIINPIKRMKKLKLFIVAGHLTDNFWKAFWKRKKTHDDDDDDERKRSSFKEINPWKRNIEVHALHIRIKEEEDGEFPFEENDSELSKNEFKNYKTNHRTYPFYGIDGESDWILDPEEREGFLRLKTRFKGGWPGYNTDIEYFEQDSNQFTLLNIINNLLVSF